MLNMGNAFWTLSTNISGTYSFKHGRWTGGSRQDHLEHTGNKAQVLPDSSYPSLGQKTITSSVSGLQSGFGKWFSLKPVPKS